MSLPRQYTYTTTGTKDVVNLNWLQNPFNTSVLMNLPSGTATWSLQYTFDDPANVSNWLTFSTVSGVSATTLFAIAQAVTAIRLNITAISGTLILSVIQGPGSL